VIGSFRIYFYFRLSLGAKLTYRTRSFCKDLRKFYNISIHNYVEKLIIYPAQNKKKQIEITKNLVIGTHWYTCHINTH